MDENGNMKELDLTNPEAIRKCKELLNTVEEMTADNPFLSIWMNSLIGADLATVKAQLDEAETLANKQNVEEVSLEDKVETIVNEYLKRYDTTYLSQKQRDNIKISLVEYTKWLYDNK
jgi:hypothetical protein